MNIILYFKSGDPYSDMVKNLLRYYEVEFEMIEVSRNKEILKEVSGQYNTPVLKVDEKVYVGFDREKIKELLNLK